MEGLATPTDPPSDFVTFGHYRVERKADTKSGLDELGRGAMGVTYRAFDPRLRIHVALKVIAAADVQDERARRRFEREASAAAQLDHPNVAGAKHLGEEGGEFFYAMTFVPGRSLADLLKAEGRLPLPIALALAAQVADALDAAHRSELIHRDLKPSNLMVLEGDAVRHESERTAAAGHRQVKVIDFGLARTFGASRADDSLATHTSSLAGFAGTPAYASPEQCAGATDLDGRSDLYSLGIILWLCITGHLPFHAEPLRILWMHQSQPPPMKQLDGQPVAVVKLLAGLLEKDPSARRPPTAGELRDHLDDLRRRTTQPAPAVEWPSWPVLFGLTAGVLLALSPFVLIPKLRNALSAPAVLATGPTPSARARAAEAAKQHFAASLIHATKIMDASDRARAQSEIAEAQAKADHLAATNATLEAAKATAATIADAPTREFVQVRIAQAQVKVGDLTGARTTAATIEDGYRKTFVQSEIAEAQAKAGDLAGSKAAFEAAKTAAVTTKEVYYARVPAQIIIVVAQTKAGDLAGAKATAATIKSLTYQLMALDRIAVAQAKAGDVTGAKATAATIPDDSSKAKVLGAIGAAQAKAGDLPGANLVFDQAKVMAGAGQRKDDVLIPSLVGYEPKSSALCEIAEAQAKAGDVTRAKATTATITTPQDKARAQSAIAEAQAKAGDMAAAKSSFESARAMAETIKFNFRESTLKAIAEAQAKAGDVAGATATMATLEHPSYKADTLRVIAAAQAWKHGIGLAEDWVKTFTEPRERCYAHLGVAEAAGAMAQEKMKPNWDEED